MGNEFVEQLIRMEAEQSAQQTYGVDYCELSPDRRYLLRRQAIEPGVAFIVSSMKVFAALSFRASGARFDLLIRTSSSSIVRWLTLLRLPFGRPFGLPLLPLGNCVCFGG